MLSWPYPFFLYINDYVDDNSLCDQASNKTQLNEAINSDLEQLDTWLQGNKLSLNVAKTQSMLIKTKLTMNWT